MNFDPVTRRPCVVQPPAPPDPRCNDPAFALSNPDVCATVAALIIRPSFALLCELESVQFRVFEYLNNTEVEVTSDCRFASSNQNVFSVGVNGGAGTALSTGVVTVTATKGSKVARATILSVGGACCDESTTGASAIVVDASRSMSTDFNGGDGGDYTSRLAYAKAVGSAYVGNLLVVNISEVSAPKDSVKIWSLGEEITEQTGFISDTNLLRDAIDSIPQSLESTNLLLAVTTAAADLLDATADRKILVIVSDGEHTTDTERQDIIDAANDFKLEGGIIICIGVRAGGTGYDLLERICTVGFFLNGTANTQGDVIQWLRFWKDLLCVGECNPAGDVFVNQPALDYSSFQNWEVIEGQVHLLGPGLLDLQPGNGLYVDMAGGSPAIIKTIDAFTLDADNYYRVRFRAAGNQRAAVTNQRLKVYLRDVTAVDGDPNLFESVVSLDFDQDFQNFALAFNPPADVTVRLYFEQLYDGSPPIRGNLLDSVVLENSSTGEVLFDDDFDGENQIYIPPRCGPSSAVEGIDDPEAPEVAFQSDNGKNAEVGPNLVPGGSVYDGGGELEVPVTVGQDYLWVAVGGETCLNNGFGESSNVVFTAKATPLVLGGDPSETVFASVHRANTSRYQYSKYTYGYSWVTNEGETGITPVAYEADFVEFLATSRRVTMAEPPEGVTSARLWRSLGEGHTVTMAGAGTAGANGVYTRVTDKRWNQTAPANGHYLQITDATGDFWTLFDNTDTQLYLQLSNDDFPDGPWTLAAGIAPAPTATVTMDAIATEAAMFLLAELSPEQTVYIDGEDREFFEARYEPSVTAPTENTTAVDQGVLGFGYEYCCGYGELGSVGDTELVPPMTSNTEAADPELEGYIVSENPDTQTEDPSQAWEAFDGTANLDGWFGTMLGPTPPWIQFQFPVAHRITAYRIATAGYESHAGNIGAPKSWNLSGSNDGVNFTVIDTVTGFIGFTGAEEAPFEPQFQRFEVDSPSTFSIYRLEITALQDGSLASISEMQFESAGTTSTNFPEDCEDCLDDPGAQLPDLEPTLDIEGEVEPVVNYTSTKNACFRCPEGFQSISQTDLAFLTLTDILAGAGPWSQTVELIDPTIVVGHYELGAYTGGVGDETLCGPKDWTFQGSADNSTWVTLDTQADQQWASESQRYYLQNQGTAYRYYRIVITAFSCGPEEVAADFNSLTESFLHPKGSTQACIGATESSQVSQSHADQLAFITALQGATDAFFATNECATVWTRTVSYTAACDADDAGSGADVTMSSTYTSLISENHALSVAERRAREAAIAALVCA